MLLRFENSTAATMIAAAASAMTARNGQLASCPAESCTTAGAIHLHCQLNGEQAE